MQRFHNLKFYNALVLRLFNNHQFPVPVYSPLNSKSTSLLAGFQYSGGPVCLFGNTRLKTFFFFPVRSLDD